MRGPKSDVTVHMPSGKTTDSEGLWVTTFSDVCTVRTSVNAYKRSEEPQTAHQDWERGRIVILLEKSILIDLDFEVTVCNSIPNQNLDGRYKVRGVRHYPLHTRVLAHVLEEE